MEKSQSELYQEILRRFHNKGVLKDVILIGSWCIPLYKKYCLKESIVPSLRTMDIDFFIPEPKLIKSSVPSLVRYTQIHCNSA